MCRRSARRSRTRRAQCAAAWRCRSRTCPRATRPSSSSPTVRRSPPCTVAVVENTLIKHHDITPTDPPCTVPVVEIALTDRGWLDSCGAGVRQREGEDAAGLAAGGCAGGVLHEGAAAGHAEAERRAAVTREVGARLPSEVLNALHSCHCQRLSNRGVSMRCRSSSIFHTVN